MKKLVCTPEAVEKLQKEYEDWLAVAELTGIQCIDDIFGPLMVGGMYMVCAYTGAGKSSFLLATAKKLLKNGKRVIFVTIEQNQFQLAKYLPKDDKEGNFTLYELESWSDWDIIKQDIDEDVLLGKRQPDYVIFDYLGGDCVESWDELVNKAGELAQYAKNKNLIIFTACQATKDLITEFKTDNWSQNFNTPMYIAYSKGMATKIYGGIYLVRQNDKDFYIYNFKNRQTKQKIGPYILSNFDLENKEFKEVN